MGEKLRIVLAEDEALVAEMVAGLVRELGHEVVSVAGDGRQAVDLVREHAPSAVMLDIRMPDMDGLEAARRITAETPTPIVILSAFETPGMIDEAGEAGVGAYLTKPPNARELDRALTIAVARFADLAELRRLNEELTRSLRAVRTLSGMVPICSGCKRIRDAEGTWHELEAYLHGHSGAKFSHGMCPECLSRYYPEYGSGD